MSWLHDMGNEWDRLKDSDIDDEPSHDNYWLYIGAVVIFLGLWWGCTLIAFLLN